MFEFSRTKSKTERIMRQLDSTLTSALWKLDRLVLTLVQKNSSSYKHDLFKKGKTFPKNKL